MKDEIMPHEDVLTSDSPLLRQSKVTRLPFTVVTEEPRLVPLADLKEHPENPNRGDVDAIEESIGENGWYGSVIAQRDTGYIIAGNHRYRAAKRHGATELWVEYADVNDAEAKRIMLADNRTAQLARLDTDGVAAVLASVKESVGTLAGTGFDEKAMKDMVGETTPERAGKSATEAKEVFDSTRTRQIVFVFEQEDYEYVTERLRKVQEAAQVTSNIGALLYLTRRYQA